MGASLNLVHRAPDRHKFYAAVDPLSWSPGLDCWVSANPQLMLEVLRDQRFAVIDFGQEFNRLSSALGVDLQAAVDMFKHTPLGHNGPEHAQSRKRMALLIRQNSPVALQRFTAVLTQKLSAAVDRTDEFDIVSQVFAPSVTALMQTLGGVRIDESDHDTSLSQIFDRMLSINRRKRLSRRIGATVALHSSDFSIDELNLRTAVSVIGADSILGTLISSFIWAVKHNANRSLSHYDWGDRTPATGVPYVDRLATEDIELNGRKIEHRQRLRLYVDAFQFNGATHGNQLFGAGRHACLGKSLSIKAWDILMREFGKYDKTVRIADVQFRKADFLFNNPKLVKAQFANV